MSKGLRFFGFMNVFSLISYVATIFYLTAATSLQADVDLETPAGSSAEIQIRVDQAPLAVQHTIKQHAGNASINLFKQFENGRFIYEAQFLKNGVPNELKVGRDGIVLMRREPRVPTIVVPNLPESGTDLPLTRAPALVQETVREQAGTNQVERIRKHIKDDGLVYRAEFIREGVRVKIAVAKNGTLISPSARRQIREAAGSQK